MHIRTVLSVIYSESKRGVALLCTTYEGSDTKNVMVSAINFLTNKITGIKFYAGVERGSPVVEVLQIGRKALYSERLVNSCCSV